MVFQEKLRSKQTQFSNLGSKDIIRWRLQIRIVLRNEVTFTLSPLSVQAAYSSFLQPGNNSVLFF